MRKIVLTLLVAMFMVSNLFAQDAKCGSCKKQDRAQQKTEMMAQKLDLDDTQKAKLLELNKKFESQLQSASCDEKNTETKECCKKKELKKKSCCEKQSEAKRDCCKEKQDGKSEKCGIQHNGQRPPKKICPKKMKQLNEEYTKKLQTILNAEQFAKLKKGCSECDHNKSYEDKYNK